MTSRSYILQEMERICQDELGVPFRKLKASMIPHFSDEDGFDFIYCLGIEDEDGDTKELLNFTFSFVVCISINEDPSFEELIELEDKAEELSNRFRKAVQNIPKIELLSHRGAEVFRDNTNLGLGKSLILEIRMLDIQNYC